MTWGLAPEASVVDERWRSVQRILVVRLDNLGDVLMSTPAMAAVRRGLPHARITLLTSPSGASALPHLPMVDDAIAYDAPWVANGRCFVNDEEALGYDQRMLERLIAERFDAAIIMTVATQSALPAALLCRQAGIRLCLAHARENPYRLMSDWVKDTDVVRNGMRHEVQRHLDLVAHIGLTAPREGLSFELKTSDAANARRKLAKAAGRELKGYVAIHPGATAPSRRYDAASFGEVAALVASAGKDVVFLGASAEASLIDVALSSMEKAGERRGVVLNEALTLGELGALIADADVLIANNSAPAHIAAAVGTPVVDLYALTNPQHTPWMARGTVLSHDVPCRNCLRSLCPEGHHQCLRGVAPSTVADAALAWMHAPAATISSTQHLALEQP